MSETKHTSGPWRIGNHTSCVVTDTPIPKMSPDLVEFYGGYLVCESVAPQNINILSAAPELYEALKRLTEYGDVFRYRTIERNPYEQAMEALAKAEGKG